MKRKVKLVSTVYADPPWPYKDAGKPRSTLARNRGVQRVNDLGYGVLPLKEIKRFLKQLPFRVGRDAHLYLWTTNSFMKEAHEVAESWGFKVKTILTWVKVTQDGTNRPSMKTGYYYRSATEHCLFCVRGSLKLRGPCRPTAYLLPREPHSVKPDFFRDLIEEQSPGPYLELFARSRREGWYQHGNQLDVSLPRS